MSKSELFHDGISSFGTPRAIVNGLIFRCSHATSMACGVVEARMELLKASEARRFPPKTLLNPKVEFTGSPSLFAIGVTVSMQRSQST